MTTGGLMALLAVAEVVEALVVVLMVLDRGPIVLQVVLAVATGGAGALGVFFRFLSLLWTPLILMFSSPFSPTSMVFSLLMSSLCPLPTLPFSLLPTLLFPLFPTLPILPFSQPLPTFLLFSLSFLLF